MRKNIYCLTLGVVLCAVTAIGQEIGGATINGSVIDPSGGLIAGAKITATQTATGTQRTTQTSSAGFYSLSALAAGSYDVTVEGAGFKKAKFAAVAVSVGAVLTLDAHLEVGGTQEIVDVTADAPVVETTRSQTSTVVNQKAIADLPINGRNFLDFAVLTPGVVRDPSRSGDLSFGGQRGTANSLTVDGADANNVFFGQSTGRAGTGRSPYSFSQDAVQEFQVSANGYAAEVGRAGGGVINVITKSGTNDWHGTAFEFFRDKSLNANSWENNRARQPKRNYHFNQFGGNLGGPIVKNKAFFFFDYDGQRNSEPITVIPGAAAPSDALSQQAFQSLQKYFAAYPRSLNNDVYLGKVDLFPTASQRLSIRYNANRFTGVNYENSGSTSAAGHTGNSSVTTDNVSAAHTFVLSSAAVLESRVTYTRDNEPGDANSTDPEAVIRQAGATVINIGRNNFSPRYTNARTVQWADSVSYVRGRHTFKAGIDLNFEHIDNFFPGNFSGSYTFNSYADFASNKPFSFTQAFAGSGTDGPLSRPNVNEYAMYAQDSWRVSEQLTLNFGVRYDLFDLANPKVRNPDPGLAAANLDTSLIPLDKNNIGGRFGFAYRLTQTGKTVLRGGAGNYYARTPTIMTGTAFTQNGIQVQTYTLTANLPSYPNVLSAPPALNRTPDIYVFAKDYVQPLTWQWSLNLERQLGRDYAVTLGYLGVRGEHLSRTRDINFLPEVPLQGSFADGTPVTYLRHPGRANPAFGRISLFDSGADSVYHGGFVQLSKRFSQNFQVQTSYTFSKVVDSRPDFTSVVVGTDDSKNAQDTLTPNLERGRGNADITHRFVFSSVWDINYGKSLQNAILRNLLRGYQLSLIANVQSGRTLTASVGGDPNGDTNTSTDRPPYVGRNTYTGPNFATADIRFTRDIRLYRERAALRLIFEAFNVTNRANFNSITTAQ
ncbi:MAG TPA: carboxypeptidase regulatory-like domain-containing protein, partial [Bryobacteraceae bacterium]|nr:carboxypeptidase regulatory-like domain-containing protein [Bryobacteraceae bacterium]